MKIGVPKEIKVHEYRVGLVPAGVRELVDAGHQVLVQSGAGAGIGFEDSHYQAAGATIAAQAADVFARRRAHRQGQGAAARRVQDAAHRTDSVHLPASRGRRRQAEALLASGATAIAYETVTAADGSLPLLTPMSEVAGRMSVQVGANCLQKANGGFGVLLGGVPGVPPAKVVILGGGVSGTHAAEMAVGLRADVTVVDRSVKRLRELSTMFSSQLKTVYSTAHAIEELVRDADLVIGAVLIAGRGRAEARHARHGEDHEAGRGAGRHRHRPRRLLRDQPADHACRAHLRARRGHPLLRDQHAGRRAPHLHVRADQRHAALRQGASPIRAGGRRSRAMRASRAV